RGNTGSQASAAGKQDPPATGSSKGSDAAKAADPAIPRLLGDAIARRRRREGRAAIQQVADPRGQITVREAQEILDKELARLPDKFRVPLVLCYLEGLTRDEAAKQLGVPPSTLKGRLEQARERLRARLASPGLAVAGALVASIFSE